MTFWPQVTDFWLLAKCTEFGLLHVEHGSFDGGHWILSQILFSIYPSLCQCSSNIGSCALGQLISKMHAAVFELTTFRGTLQVICFPQSSASLSNLWVWALGHIILKE